MNSKPICGRTENSFRFHYVTLTLNILEINQKKIEWVNINNRRFPRMWTFEKKNSKNIKKFLEFFVFQLKIFNFPSPFCVHILFWCPILFSVNVFTNVNAYAVKRLSDIMLNWHHLFIITTTIQYEKHCPFYLIILEKKPSP